MIEADRVLRPLREAEPAIERLDTYESPAALTEALRATWHGVERTLRMLLRSDTTVPEEVRLVALSPEQMSVETVLTELRRRDLISLGLAGRVHELRQAIVRAERGDVRAADADTALDVVRQVRGEVQGNARRATTARQAVEPPAEEEFDEADVIGYRAGAALPRRTLILIGGVLALLVVVALGVVLLGGESRLAQGVTAFQAKDYATAERHFRAALEDDSDDNTARLYLARILRSDGRIQEAQQVLREAGETDPEDPAVRRELGYLLLDADRASLAAEQFRRAVELDPEDPLNWVGLVESLTRAGDPSAAEWLKRAPEEARTMLEQRRTRGTSP